MFSYIQIFPEENLEIIYAVVKYSSNTVLSVFLLNQNKDYLYSIWKSLSTRKSKGNQFRNVYIKFIHFDLKENI
jgi:hypothetical protein